MMAPMGFRELDGWNVYTSQSSHILQLHAHRAACKPGPHYEIAESGGVKAFFEDRATSDISVGADGLRRRGKEHGIC